ncbi:importin alpha isoform 2 [Artemisia annua]|uniref:Importin subunit alpha n=1 Tax=Artemisia annua TaxID=35608 RepID=A0A2U1NXM0_ARTAN|nr:importin alpha isoform 2 [Artemisia annua]
MEIYENKEDTCMFLNRQVLPAKKAFTACAGTACIEDDLFKIRKKKRDEILHSKRQLQHPSTIVLGKKFERMYPMVYKLYSNDNNMQLEAAIAFSEVLKTGVRKPPIKEVAYLGVIPRFVEFLMREDFPELQLPALEALINITWGTSEIVKAVVDNGAVPSLVKLLDSPSDDIREKAICALGNIAADSLWSRDIVLDQGALQPLLAQSHEHARLSMLRTVAFTLSSLCSGTPPPTLAKIHTALPALARFTNSSCHEILECACHSLWNLAVKDHMIQPIIDAGVEYGLIQRLVQHIGHCCSSVRTPAIATVMNIVDRSPRQVQAIVDFGAFPLLLNVITNRYGTTNVEKEYSCWTVAHIASENENRVQSVFEAGLIPPIVKLLRTSDVHNQVDLLKAVVVVIFHVTAKGSNEHVRYLADQGCIKPLCNLLVSTDPAMLLWTLEVLENMLNVGEVQRVLAEDDNYYADLILDSAVIGRLYALQKHNDANVFSKAITIYKTYVQVEGSKEAVEGTGDQLSKLQI